MKTLIVTIQITDHDYEHMIRHFTSSRLGYPIVQVLRMVRAPPVCYCHRRSVVALRAATDATERTFSQFDIAALGGSIT